MWPNTFIQWPSEIFSEGTWWPSTFTILFRPLHVRAQNQHKVGNAYYFHIHSIIFIYELTKRIIGSLPRLETQDADDWSFIDRSSDSNSVTSSRRSVTIPSILSLTLFFFSWVRVRTKSWLRWCSKNRLVYFHIHVYCHRNHQHLNKLALCRNGSDDHVMHHNIQQWMPSRNTLYMVRKCILNKNTSTNSNKATECYKCFVRLTKY